MTAIHDHPQAKERWRWGTTPYRNEATVQTKIPQADGISEIPPPPIRAEHRPPMHQRRRPLSEPSPERNSRWATAQESPDLRKQCQAARHSGERKQPGGEGEKAAAAKRDKSTGEFDYLPFLLPSCSPALSTLSSLSPPPPPPLQYRSESVDLPTHFIEESIRAARRRRRRRRRR